MQFLISTVESLYPYCQVAKLKELGFKVKVDTWVRDNSDKNDPYIELEKRVPKEHKNYRITPQKRDFKTLEELMEFQAKCGHSLIIHSNSAGNSIRIYDGYNE